MRIIMIGNDYMAIIMIGNDYMRIIMIGNDYMTIIMMASGRRRVLTFLVMVMILTSFVMFM